MLRDALHWVNMAVVDATKGLTSSGSGGTEEERAARIQATGRMTEEDFKEMLGQLVRTCSGWRLHEQEGRVHAERKGCPCRRRVEAGPFSMESWLASEQAAQSELPELPDDGVVLPSADVDLDLDDDPAAVQSEADPELRFYDVRIAYLDSRQVPILFMQGYSSTTQPLSESEMREDIAQQGLVTRYAHNGDTMMNIHACDHAKWLKHQASTDDSAHASLLLSMKRFLGVVGLVIPHVELLSAFEQLTDRDGEACAQP
eukprot:TRINITY_DN73401_c0_g1_i1.p2 TRINITY_DN73401_c0_g1~~TRINITY_DN73401_c0_g1_i1.p2  ORF type:complete len:288 (+),score=85.21 TRINITY_DN73401_c0_g1_i1:92-865(+)